MAVHSRIGASSYYRWQACPGSVKLSEGIESVSSVYAEEGTLAHEIAAAKLLNEPWDLPFDADMWEAIQVYLLAVNSVAQTVDRSKGDLFLVEKKFDLSSVYPGLFGTCDAVVYKAKEKILYVFDYKHGAGIPVEVEHNVQLMYYGLGALIQTGVACEEIELVIVQPRCPHPDGLVRRWRFKSIDLLDFAADLADAAKRTEDPSAPLVPGEHCRFCPAAGICPALHGKALAQAQQEFSALNMYEPEKLSKALEWLPTLEGWIKSVRDFAYQESLHGRTPPGWKLVPKRASRKISDEKEVVARANALHLERDIYEPLCLKSVAQLEKTFGKKDFEGIFGDLVVSISSGETLVPLTDPRQSIKTDPKDEFSVIPIETNNGG